MREEQVMVVFFLAGAIFGTVWVIAHYCYATSKAWMETGLKRDMVARGYTAQEIVQVVAARKSSKPKDETDVPPAKPIQHPAYG